MKHNSLLILASVFFSFLLISANSVASNCSSQLGQCRYYKCVQDEIRCSDSDYLSGFAIPYCYKYQADQKNYSDRGQIFLSQVRYCLQAKIEDFTNENPYACKDLREYAIHSHIGCYLNSGFCELSMTEKMRIVLTAKKDLIHGDVRKAGLETMKLCNQSRFSMPFPGTY